MTLDNPKETHPSYGMLGFYRQSGGSRHLFGSSVENHRDTICLRLKRGAVRRDLNQDWYYGGEELFEVRMSYNQFATLITAMNVGDGVPVTITRLDGERVEDPPFTDKAEQHLEEFRHHLDKTNEETRNLINMVMAKFHEKKAFTKKEQEEILSTLNHIAMNIGCNADFHLSQFQEQMDKTVTEAKGEVEAFVQNKMLALAQMTVVEEGPQVLTEGMSAPALTTGKKKLKRVEGD